MASTLSDALIEAATVARLVETAMTVPGASCSWKRSLDLARTTVDLARTTIAKRYGDASPLAYRRWDAQHIVKTPGHLSAALIEAAAAVSLLEPGTKRPADITDASVVVLSLKYLARANRALRDAIETFKTKGDRS